MQTLVWSIILSTVFVNVSAAKRTSKGNYNGLLAAKSDYLV